jgi:hypothetical protein
MEGIIALNGNNGYANAPQCYRYNISLPLLLFSKVCFRMARSFDPMKDEVKEK